MLWLMRGRRGLNLRRPSGCVGVALIWRNPRTMPLTGWDGPTSSFIWPGKVCRIICRLGTSRASFRHRTDFCGDWSRRACGGWWWPEPASNTACSRAACARTAAAEPSNPYGVAKDTLRRHLEALKETAPFDLRWLRLFYLYGPGQPKTSLYSQFQAAMARGDTTFDMSGGEQLRDFMAVETAAAAIVDVALAAEAPRIVNICSGAPIVGARAGGALARGCDVRHRAQSWRAAVSHLRALRVLGRQWASCCRAA